jgi:quercetin dioxygenase-like cupin family protein
MAQDELTLTKDEPTRENPNGPIGTEVVFENDRVRVWDMRVGPRGKKAWHHHKLDYIIISVTGGKVEIENVEGHSYIGDDKVGGVIWQAAGQRHELRNLTDAPYQNILVELKQSAKP